MTVCNNSDGTAPNCTNGGNSNETIVQFYELAGLIASPTDQSGGTSAAESGTTYPGPTLTTTAGRELLLEAGVAFGTSSAQGCNTGTLNAAVLSGAGYYVTCYELLKTKGAASITFSNPNGGTQPYWTSGISLIAANGSVDFNSVDF